VSRWTKPERTIEQDPTFAFRIVIDIALKALSPATVVEGAIASVKAATERAEARAEAAEEALSSTALRPWTSFRVSNAWSECSRKSGFNRSTIRRPRCLLLTSSTVCYGRSAVEIFGPTKYRMGPGICA
jgi:hypothetical protein